jgi:hypothetical protein
VPTPLFLLSLPRSGSTLVQRILARHPGISTGPEPTFLLPVFNLTSERDVVATYDHRYTSWAIDDFFASLGESGFRTTVREWATSAYERASDPAAEFFLDKTPKYHQIATEIVETFPDAPIVILWRNPLAVIGSILTTWGGGRWILHHFRLDLFEGLPNLVEVIERFPSRVFVIRYEDLVADPEAEARRLLDHLGLDFDPRVLDDFAGVELVGRVQDPNVGSAGFTTVREDRVDRWGTVLSNPIRIAWCRRYLRWIGVDRLAVMGYDLHGLIAQLDAVPTSRRHLASDLVRIPYDFGYRALELGLFAKKLRDFRGGRRRVLAHK